MVLPLFLFAYAAAPRSPLPLTSQLAAEHGTAVHPQHYNPHRRALADVLTLDNTKPIRLHLDFKSLDQTTAVEYSTCFSVGAWFRRGLPESPTPPANGIPTCLRGANEWDLGGSGCWGICRESDVVTPTRRQLMVRAMESVAQEVSGFFSVEPVEGSLVFRKNTGRYSKALEEKGYPPLEACASDCTTTSNVAVDPSYCTSGVNADAVLSLIRSPPMQGIGGTGTSCVGDQSGRPLWLVFDWIEEVDESESFDALLARVRGLILHEIIHALGFSNAAFSYARNSAGERKTLLTKKHVVDADGATDSIWFFGETSRAYAMAKNFFGCLDDASWDGLPLMGLPELGRASHWETRILRDDVMSYGGRAVVSTVTLAAMEDLGHYVANYSAAQCMHWGRAQGCDFVKSRCGVLQDERSAVTASAEDCKGDPVWATPYIPAIDNYLSAKCARGLTPCDTLSRSGFQLMQDGTKVCNAQCHTSLEGRSDCSAGPSEPVEGTSEKMERLVEENWQQFLWLLVWLLGVIFAASCARAVACPKQGSKGIVICLSMLLGFVGGIFLGCAAYGLFYDFEFVSGFVGVPTLYGLASIGGALVVLLLLTLFAVCCSSRCLLLLVFLLYIFFVLIQAGSTVLVFYWSYLVTSVTGDTVDTLSGNNADGKWDGHLGETALKEVEGIMCRTYQLCCRDLDASPSILPFDDFASGSGSGIQSDYASGFVEAPASDTCLQQHAGQTVDIAVVMQDPSSDNFCPYVSGSDRSVKPAVGTCDFLNWAVTDFSLSACQEKLCVFGIDGYEEFTEQVVNWMRSNAIIIGAVSAFAVLFQLILSVNLWKLRKRLGRVNPESESSTKKQKGKAVKSQRTVVEVKPKDTAAIVRP